MKLPPMPHPNINAIGQWDEPSVSEWEAWGERCYKAGLEAAAKVCEAKVMRPAGYRGQWEGYGELPGEKTGPECAAAIRAMKG